MKLKLRAAGAGITTLAVAGALLIGGAALASAAPPPYEPDAINQLGQLLFYDAAGNLVTSGTIQDDPFAKYVVATTDKPATDTATKAQLYGYLPVNGQPPGAWSGEQLSTATTFPAASAPASISGLGSNRPVVTQAPGDNTLEQLVSDFPNNATDSYQGLYQLRVKIFGEPKWWAADIKVTGSNWTLVYPQVATTTTTLTASPASPQTVTPAGSTPTSVTLTATTTGATSGTVQFTKNGANLGSPVPVTGGTATTTDVPGGPTPTGSPVTTNYTAVFTPSGAFSGSNGSLPYVVQNKAGDATATTLAVVQTGLAGDPVTFNSNVSDTETPGTTPAGTVSFFDNGGTTAVASATVSSSGAASATLATGLPAGPHSIVAKFVPTSSTAFAASQSAPVTFTLTAAGSPCANTLSACTDPQYIKVTVDAGTLIISTPYTQSTPFDLGTMQLDSSGAFFHAAKPFGTAADTGHGIQITSTEAGDPAWTASVYSGDFTSGTNSINGQNFGFTGVTAVPVGSNPLGTPAKPVVVNDVPVGPSKPYAAAATGTDGLKGSASAQHVFAKAANGDGTVAIVGNLDLYAPTSTPAGSYTGVLTFTIV